jgi:DNA-binding XRE family transcriptional regulator
MQVTSRAIDRARRARRALRAPESQISPVESPTPAARTKDPLPTAKRASLERVSLPAAKEVDVHIGRRVRWRRKLLGLTQHELADALGVTFQQVYKYECGLSRIMPARLWALSRMLQVEVGYFFDGLPPAGQATRD